MLKKIKDHWISTKDIGQNSPTEPMAPFVPVANLIGAPDDRGVLNVGGRLGAGHAPMAVRRMLSQFMLGIEGAISRVELYQGHDIALGETIEDGHNALRSAVSSDLKSKIVPIVLGGGHDYGFPHVAAATDVFGEKVALINIDSHLDVRPTTAGITSGSPFFMALEQKAVKSRNFVEFGIQEHCNDESYFQYVRKKGVNVISLEKARGAKGGSAASFEKLLAQFSKKGLKIIVSFDVDAVQMAHAPGVSAPQSDGFNPAEFLAMAKACGENSNVATIGFVELAPDLDHHQQTTRLVATAIHRFLSGLGKRHLKRKVRRLFR